MQIVAISKPQRTAEFYFRQAHAFYAAHGQADSAIALMTAGLIALSEQVAQIASATDGTRR